MRRLCFAVAVAVGLLWTGVAAAQVTVTITGPSDYTSSEWKYVTINNQNAAGNYTGVIYVCPSSSNPTVPGSCSAVTFTTTTLPGIVQTMVNFMITQWCNDPANANVCPP